MKNPPLTFVWALINFRAKEGSFRQILVLQLPISNQPFLSPLDIEQEARLLVAKNKIVHG